MTRDEAVKVLEANDYCVKHLSKMSLDLERRYSLDSYWHCLECDAEQYAVEESARIQRKAQLSEAIALLKGGQ